MNYEPFELNNEEFQALLKKCTKMLIVGNEVYFDVSEFLELIEYYSEKNEDGDYDEVLQQLYTYAQKQHGFNTEIEASRAMFLIDSECEDEALEILHKLSKLEPSNEMHASNLSIVYIRKGDISSALFQLKRAIALNPENEESIVEDVVVELYLNAYFEEAQKILQSILSKFPENTDLLHYSALCYNSIAQPEKAVELLKKKIEIVPYNYDAWFNLGVSYWQLELFEKAIEALDYTLAINASLKEVYILKASCFLAQSETHKAIEVLNDLLEFVPEDLFALEVLSDCYSELNEFSKAEECWQKILTIDSSHAKTWANIAKKFVREEEYQKAIETYEKALNIDPENVTILMDFAHLLNVLGLYENALDVCKRAVKQEKTNAEVWLKYANMERSNQNFEKALKVLQKSLKYVDDAVIHYTIAEIYVELKKIEKAVEYFTFAYEQEPEMSEVFFENCIIPQKQLELFHSVIHTNL